MSGWDTYTPVSSVRGGRGSRGRGGRGARGGRGGRGSVDQEASPSTPLRQPHGSLQMQVLKTATQIKLRELNAHEHKLREHYEALLTAAEGSANRLETLHDGVKDLQVVQTSLHPDLEPVGALVEFAATDKWSTRQSVALREAQLTRQIKERRSLWRHNKLLGALLQESLQQETNTNRQEDADTEWEALETEQESSVVKMTKEETQAQLENYFFSPAPDVTEAQVLEYLETQVFHRHDHFSKEQWKCVCDALGGVRNSLDSFSDDFFEGTKVTSEEVKEAISLLLRDRSSLSDEVVAFLSDVVGSTQTQEELAHVLTIELTNLHEFTWPEEGVSVQFKRGMNGRFRCHLQEEAIPLLLFQYVGMKWGEEMHDQLRDLLLALAPSDSVPPPSVEATRRELRRVFTLAALDPRSPGYDEDGERQIDKLANATKQDILRLVCTEARYAALFEGADTSITAVTTDLEFFGPSVAHAAVMATLKFLGVGEKARNVFSRYMGIPLVFPGAKSPRVMQRGLSVGRAMTMFLSEVLMFVMDFSVLATTNIHLFRRHDDIFFYDRDAGKMEQAWERMHEWAKVAGLKFNEGKTGATRVQWKVDGVEETEVLSLPASLPHKPIHWGLLELQSDASVKILLSKADEFADDLKDRLRAAKSVFGWVNVYNKYMMFFLRNFGNVSPVFGPRHVEDMIATLQRIHERVFAQDNGDVLAALRHRIALRHGALIGDELPAAWAQWPLELGGLGLFNPFVAVWAMRSALRSTYLTPFHTRVLEPWPVDEKQWPWREPFTTAHASLLSRYAVYAERVANASLASVYEDSTSVYDAFLFLASSTVQDSARVSVRMKRKFDDSFRLRTEEEFLRVVAMARDDQLTKEFRACVMQADEVAPTHVSAATMEAKGHFNSYVPASRRNYCEWLAHLFSEQIMDEFGTVSFFSRELLPAQLISTIKSTAVAW